jgi:hypothetical protein
MFIDGASDSESNFRLRFHTAAQYHDFAFTLALKLKSDEVEKAPLAEVTADKTAAKNQKMKPSTAKKGKRKSK